MGACGSLDATALTSQAKPSCSASALARSRIAASSIAAIAPFPASARDMGTKVVARHSHQVLLRSNYRDRMSPAIGGVEAPCWGTINDPPPAEVVHPRASPRLHNRLNGDIGSRPPWTVPAGLRWVSFGSAVTTTRPLSASVI